jgi:hypothetical protein
MTTRDKILLGVVAAIVAVAGYWFLLLAPQRKQAADLGKQVAAQRKDLLKAQAAISASRGARASYASDYATVARLGKAVPVDDDVPSLVYQLQAASSSTSVDFSSIKLLAAGSASDGSSGGSSSGGSSSGGSSKSGSSKSGAAKGSGSQGGSDASGSQSGSGASGSQGASGASASQGAGAAGAATQAAAAGLPPGAAIGPAGFATMPFSFTFEGDFFRLSGFFRKLERFVVAGHDRVRVDGRLLTVDGIALTPSPEGFPKVTASVVATAYLLPDAEGLLGSATPSGPGGAASGGTTATGTAGTSTPAPATAAATAP